MIMKKHLILSVLLLTSCSAQPDFSNAARSETAIMSESGAVIFEDIDAGEDEPGFTETTEGSVVCDTQDYLTYTADIIISLENDVRPEDIDDLLKENNLSVREINDTGIILSISEPVTDEQLTSLTEILSEDSRISSAEVYIREEENP